MKILLAFTLLLLFTSCQSKVDGNFFISNGSSDQPDIPLRLIIDEDTIFDQIAKYSNIAPDLQYIESVELSKGTHEITFEVANSGLKKIEKLDFPDDRWVFLSYHFEEPADSLERARLDKTFSIKDSSNLFLYNGRRPSLVIHVMEEEPVHH